MSQYSYAQTMVGAAIGGTVQNGGTEIKFGQSVSISADATRIVAAAPTDGSFGWVTFLEYDDASSSWTQMATNGVNLVPIGEIVRMSDDGNTVAHYDGFPQMFTTEYDAVGNIWNHGPTVQLQQFSQLDMDANADVTRIVAGRETEIRVLQENNGDTWIAMGDPIPSRGDHVAMSADGKYIAASDASTGITRVFEWDEANTAWNTIATSLSDLGGDVAISADGSLVAVASLQYDDVTIFNNTVSDIIGDHIPNGTTDDVLISLSADGKRVAVGAKGATQATKIYDYDEGGDAWAQFGNTIEFSGGEVDLTPDGSHVVIGNPAANSNMGQVQVYTLNPVSAVTNIEQTDIEIFPNPTYGELQLSNVNADQVQVFDNMGRLVFSQEQPGSSIDISQVPAGFYFLKINEGEQVYSARVVKE